MGDLWRFQNTNNFRYEDEGIDIPNLSDLTELSTPEPLVQLIDKQSTLRTSQSDLSQVRLC